jgi:hypothetical protein
LRVYTSDQSDEAKEKKNRVSASKITFI